MNLSALKSLQTRTSDRTLSVERWEVRSPLVYGSHHEGFFDTEAKAIEYATNWIDFHEAEAHLHTVGRVIYIHDDED